MTETKRGSDLGIGVSSFLAFVAVVSAIAVATTAYLSESQGSDTMQLLSGVALTVALLAAGLAILVVHVFE